MLGLRINKAHFPVSALGPGRRLAIWVQGCSIRCPGCISQDTWEFGDGLLAVDDLLDGLGAWLEEADGVTISGGEPCDQFPALVALLDGMRERGFAGDVLVFSGYELAVIEDRFGGLLDRTDALVSGPYLQDQPTDEPLRGSANQELHLLTALGRRVFADLEKAKSIDLHWDGATAWLAGIPRSGDWQRLREQLQMAGVDAQFSDDSEVQWRT